jgi:hypothetical protein
VTNGNVEADDSTVAPADQRCPVDMKVIEQSQIIIGHQSIAKSVF